MKSLTFKQRLTIGMVTAVLLAGIFTPAMADNDMEPVISDPMIIREKYEDLIVTDTDKFHVAKDIVVVDKEGNQLSYFTLSFPCEVLMHISPVGKYYPTVVKLEVQRILPGAKTGYSEEVPQ